MYVIRKKKSKQQMKSKKIRQKQNTINRAQYFII